MYDGSNITPNPRRDHLLGVISVVFFSLKGIKASLEGSQPTCEHLSKPRIPTKPYWHGEGGQICQQGVGGSCSPFVMLLWNSITTGTKQSGMMLSPQASPVLLG